MKDDREDLFSQAPSKEHVQRVTSAVASVLEDSRRRHRRGFFAWMGVAGLSTAAAAFGFITLFKTPSDRPAVASHSLAGDDGLDLIIASDSEMEPMDAALILAESEEIDVDLLDNLDLLKELNEEDFKS